MPTANISNEAEDARMITNAADATSSSQQESSVVFLGTRPDRGPDLFQPDGRKLLKFCGAVIGLAIVQVVPLGLAVLATTGSELEEPASPDPGTIIIVAISSPLEIVLLGISLCLSSCCRLHSAIMAALCIMGVASFATGIYALTVAAMSMGNSACDAAVWSERCDGALTMGLAAGIIRAFVASPYHAALIYWALSNTPERRNQSKWKGYDMVHFGGSYRAPE